MSAPQLLVLLVALAAIGIWVVRRIRQPLPQSPPPDATARPGDYVVRWEHIDFGSRTIYAGPDLKRARWLYYEAEGILAGASVEFWDGPHRRALRIH